MPCLPAADVCHSSTQHRVCVCARVRMPAAVFMLWAGNVLQWIRTHWPFSKKLSSHKVSQCFGKVAVLERAPCYNETTSMSRFMFLYFLQSTLTSAHTINTARQLTEAVFNIAYPASSMCWFGWDEACSVQHANNKKSPHCREFPVWSSAPPWLVSPVPSYLVESAAYRM